MDINGIRIHRKAGDARNRIKRLIPMLLTVVLLSWMVIKPWTISLSEATAANLVITPNTWDVVGLDHIDPSRGPTSYLIGAKVCNQGDAPANGTNALLKWADSNSTYITYGDNGVIFIGSLAVNACTEVYFKILISLTAPQGATRGYSIQITTGGQTFNSPTPRQIYVEKDSFSANPGLTITGLTGIGQPVVGQPYRVVLTGNTFAIQQMENLINYPADKLSLSSVTSNYAQPPGTTLTGPYADACGWNNNPVITTTYLSCGTTPVFDAGTITGTIVSTYTFTVLQSGAMTLTGTLYGFASSNYYYDADFGQLVLPINAINPTPTQTPTPSSTPTGTATPTVTGTPPTRTPTPTITPTGSGTPATPTVTGTIYPSPGATKVVSPLTANIGNTLTFTIYVVNTGYGPATNVVLTDSLSAYPYLDIRNLVTTQGTVNTSGRVATVTIGTLMPNQSVTVTITVYVNSTATSTYTPYNTASISYTEGPTKVSNAVYFTVYGTATLPGTGENPQARVDAGTGSSWLSSVLLGLVILAVIFLAVKLILWGRAHLSEKSRLYGIGVLVFTLMILLGIVLVSGGKQSGLDSTSLSLEMSTQTAARAGSHPYGNH